jgi:hypothetical protein
MGVNIMRKIAVTIQIAKKRIHGGIVVQSMAPRGEEQNTTVVTSNDDQQQRKPYKKYDDER